MDKKKGGWHTKTCDVVYENPWISVSHREVLTPAGTEGVYGVVHFKNHAVGVIPIDAHGNTWLVKQTRYVFDESTWEIPEGGVPFNEDPLIGAKRELEEEVGLRAESWEKLTSLSLSNSVTDETATVFVAKDLYQGTQALEETEDITLKQLPIEEAIAMALDGRITDAISVAGLLNLALLMKK